MSDVAVVLRKARDLYAANPSHALAREFPKAGTYCAVTAIHAAAPGWENRVVCDHADAILRAVTGTQHTALALPEWNAAHSTETVLAAFDKAITKADNA